MKGQINLNRIKVKSMRLKITGFWLYWNEKTGRKDDRYNRYSVVINGKVTSRNCAAKNEKQARALLSINIKNLK